MDGSTDQHLTACRIGVAEVASTVAALFRDSPNLIVSFNAFLPKRHRIRLSDEQAAGLEKPTTFVKAVMNTHPATYREFLRIIFDEYGRDGYVPSDPYIYIVHSWCGG